MSGLDLLTALVLTLVGVRLVSVARISIRTRTRSISMLRGLRPRHFLMALPVLALVLAVATALIQIPGLSFGWWTAIGGQGNPVTGVTTTTGSSKLSLVIPALFSVLLVIALPLFVEREEEMFRLGAEQRTRRDNARRAVTFGLVHAIVGIPIGVALALSVGGFYFTWAYLRIWRRTASTGLALLESIRCHLAYNLVIVTLLVVYVISAALS